MVISLVPRCITGMFNLQWMESYIRFLVRVDTSSEVNAREQLLQVVFCKPPARLWGHTGVTKTPPEVCTQDMGAWWQQAP